MSRVSVGCMMGKVSLGAAMEPAVWMANAARYRTGGVRTWNAVSCRMMSGDAALRRTPLYDDHVKMGAKMVPFCGWEMPLQ